MEGIGYFVAGLICAYLVVRSIRSIWAGGFVFLLLCCGSSYAQGFQVQIQNDTASPPGSWGWVFAWNYDGGAWQSFAGGLRHSDGSTLVNSGNPVDAGEVMIAYSTAGAVSASGTLTVAQWMGGSTYTSLGSYSITGAGDWTGTKLTAFTWHTSGTYSTPNYTNYTMGDFDICNTNAVPMNYTLTVTATGSGCADIGLEDGASYSLPIPTIAPGECLSITNVGECSFEYVITGADPSNGFEQGPIFSGTNTPSVSTNQITGIVTNSNLGTITSSDPFANIPLRPSISTNQVQADRQNAEGITKAIGQAGDKLFAGLTGGNASGNGGGKNLTDIYNVLTNGTGDGNDTNTFHIRTNTLAINLTTSSNLVYLSNMVAGVTNTVGGLQGMIEGASNLVASIYGGTGTMGGSFNSASNVDWTITNGIVQAPRPESSLMKISLGSINGVEKFINLDPAQSSSLLNDFFEMCRFTKRWWVLFIGFGLFWVMFNHVEDYTKQVILNVGRLAKQPEIGITKIVSRATFGLILVTALTTIVGILPYLAFAFISFSTGASASPPSLNVAADVNSSVLSAAIKEAMLKVFEGLLNLIPVEELGGAILQYIAFRFYMPWIFGMVMTMCNAFGVMVIGSFLLPMLLCVETTAAQLEFHNLTGTNTTWTNASRAITFPPGETRIDLETGWYLGALEVPLPATENLQVLRLSYDDTGQPIFDSAFATSPADFFWYGFACGLGIFGMTAVVSAIKNGLGGGRNNVWVSD